MQGVGRSRRSIWASSPPALPKLGYWISQAWPPKLDEMPLFLLRTAETVAMAAIGTTMAVLLAIPMAVLASRNITPFPRCTTRYGGSSTRCAASTRSYLRCCSWPRWAWGRSPVCSGIGLHTWGSAAKFFADHHRKHQPRTARGGVHPGAARSTAMAYALVPDVHAGDASTALFWWEFNVRASTVLGVVGAGGIGQELKNSMDLLDFPRLFTIIALILIVVTVLDQSRIGCARDSCDARRRDRATPDRDGCTVNNPRRRRPALPNPA